METIYRTRKWSCLFRWLLRRTRKSINTESLLVSNTRCESFSLLVTERLLGYGFDWLSDLFPRFFGVDELQRRRSCGLFNNLEAEQRSFWQHCSWSAETPWPLVSLNSDAYHIIFGAQCLNFRIDATSETWHNGIDADQAERQKLTVFPSMKSSVQAAEASIFTFSTGQIHQTENGLYVVVIW